MQPLVSYSALQQLSHHHHGEKFGDTIRVAAQMRKFVGGWEGQENVVLAITLKRNEYPHHTHMNILQTTSYPALGIFPMPLHLRMSIYSLVVDLICDAHYVCSVNSGHIT